jgi:hypothetical protein
MPTTNTGNPSTEVVDPVVQNGSPAVSGTSSDSLKKVTGKSISGGSSYASVTLNTYLASAKQRSTYGLFIGKYAYVDTSAGMQIFAVVPEAEYLAMSSGL